MTHVEDLDSLISQLTKIREEHGNLPLLKQYFGDQSDCHYSKLVTLDIGYSYEDMPGTIYSSTDCFFKYPSKLPPYSNSYNFVDFSGNNVDEDKTTKCLVFREDDDC